MTAQHLQDNYCYGINISKPIPILILILFIIIFLKEISFILMYLFTFYNFWNSKNLYDCFFVVIKCQLNVLNMKFYVFKFSLQKQYHMYSQIEILFSSNIIMHHLNWIFIFSLQASK